MLKKNFMKLLICDMAGTTIQENGLVYKTLYDTIKCVNPDLKTSEIDTFHGFNKVEVMEHYVKEKNLDKKGSRLLLNNMNKTFTDKLKENYINDPSVTLIHPGLPDYFNNLRNAGMKVALNTGYNKNIQELLINKFKLNNCIDDYISSSDVQKGRPYPHMIHALMNRNNIFDRSRIIKVGDTPVDVLEGKSAGCLTVGVLSGSSTKGVFDIVNPDYVVNNIMDIKFY